MADYSLVDYAGSMDPNERQAYAAEVERRRQRADQQAALSAANARARQFDKLAAVSSFFNNPAILKATLSAQKAAGAEAPEKLGQTGFMIPGTGEFIESPMYADEKRAAREATAANIQAQIESREREGRERRYLTETLGRLYEQGRNERASESLALRQTLAAMADTRARDLAAMKPDKEQEKIDRDTATGVQKLSAFADKKQLPRLLIQGRQLLNAVNKAGDNDVPGLTTTAQVALRVPFGDRTLNTEEIDNATAFQGIMNALTRADAGLSQTQGETLRQALETLNKPTATAKTRATVLKTHIIPLLEQLRGATLGSAPQRVRDAYRQNQIEIGGDTSWMDPLHSDKGELSSAEQAELTELKRRLGK